MIVSSVVTVYLNNELIEKILFNERNHNAIFPYSRIITYVDMVH